MPFCGRAVSLCFSKNTGGWGRSCSPRSHGTSETPRK